MEIENNTPEAIFHKAVVITDPARREEYLDQACKSNKKLQTEVEELLKAHEKAGSFLDVPDMDPNVTLDESPIAEKPGTVIALLCV